MSNAITPLNGMTPEELRAGLKVLQQARLTGALSVQYGDGTRVQYRSDAELAAQIASAERQLAALAGPDVPVPVRVVRMRPWNGFR